MEVKPCGAHMALVEIVEPAQRNSKAASCRHMFQLKASLRQREFPVSWHYLRGMPYAILKYHVFFGQFSVYVTPTV
jgi:hypothetical protein